MTARGPGKPSTWQTWTDEASPELVPVEVSPDEPAFWLYSSSGSTGRLKAAVHLHRAIPFTCRQYAQQVLELGDSDICFSAAKLFHAYGLGNGMNFPLFVGAATVLWHGPTLPEALFELISRFHPTIFFATPALFVGMLALPEADKKHDLSSLRFCVSAGEALPASTFERWRDRFGLEIVDGIGSTEMLHIFISNEARTMRGWIERSSSSWLSGQGRRGIRSTRFVRGSWGFLG